MRQTSILPTYQPDTFSTISATGLLITINQGFWGGWHSFLLLSLALCDSARHTVPEQLAPFPWCPGLGSQDSFLSSRNKPAPSSRKHLLMLGRWELVLEEAEPGRD